MRPGFSIATGAMVLTFACSGSDAPVVGNGGPTLVQVQAQVLTPHCALSGCHVSTAPPFGLDMSSVAMSRANLIAVEAEEMPGMSRIEPNDSASSYLYWKVTSNPNINGDPMPLNQAPLSQSDLDLIAAWIDGGAK